MKLQIRCADSFWSRFRGLMFRADMEEQEGLLITRCDSVHTCFMRFSIDVVFLDRTAHIVRLAPMLKPWRLQLGGRTAAHTLELSAGSIQRLGLKLGDALAPILPASAFEP